MKLITSHMGNPVNDQLQIAAIGDVGPGGAHQRYDIKGFQAWINPFRHVEGHWDTEEQERLCILFQASPIGDKPSGVTNEALLAVLIDRLEGFAMGPFPSSDTNMALEHCRQALVALKRRTSERIVRGVEGKLIP